MAGEVQSGQLQLDYSLRASSPPPPGYPDEPEPDSFATDPEQSPGDWQERRRAYLRWVTRNPAGPHLSSVFRELARLEAGAPVHLGLFDAALDFVGQHLFKGVFGSTHGRSYEISKKWARNENTTDVAKLHFGVGQFGSPECMSAPCFALSKRYRPPAALYAIARDLAHPECEIRQRIGIRIEEAARWGLGFRDLEDGMQWLSLEAYTHPATIELTMRMFDAFDWWENAFFAPLRARKGIIDLLRRTRTLPILARLFEWDMTRNSRPEVNTVTYRTPDFMLSSALDWRAGFGGDQQHLWQATLGPDAVCFTTHPGPHSARSPGHWTGSACLPRVGQVKNVVIALYRIHRRPALYVANCKHLTHAWLPRDHFDEVMERDGWIFARKDQGYLALRCSRPVHWQEGEGEDRDRELIAEGREQAWICEMGRHEVDGPFQRFVDRIASAHLAFGDPGVVYQSPSQGAIEFGWKGPFRHRGEAVPMRDFPRYDSPYAGASFPLERIRVQCGNEWLELRWDEAERLASRLLGQ